MRDEAKFDARIKEHPSGWTILKSSSPLGETSSRVLSESSEDMRDELMSVDEAQTDVPRNASPINPPLSKLQLVQKRRFYSAMSADPFYHPKKRSRVEHTDVEGDASSSKLLHASPASPETPHSPPISRRPVFAKNPFASKHSTPLNSLANQTVSTANMYPSVARKSTGGRARASRPEPLPEALEAVRCLLAAQLRTKRNEGDRQNSGTAAHEYIVISDSDDDDTSRKPPHASIEPASPETERQVYGSNTPVLSRPQNSQLDRVTMRQEEEESDKEATVVVATTRDSRPHPEPESTIVATVDLPNVNGNGMEYIIISSDSEPDNEPSPKPSSPTQRHRSKSRPVSTPSRPKSISHSTSIPASIQRGNKDEPILISDSEDESETQPSRTLSELDPRRRTPLGSVSRASIDDGLHALDGVYSDSMHSSPEPANRIGDDDDDDDDDVEPSADAPVSITKDSIASISTPRSSSTLPSPKSSPSKLKHQVTMIGTLYGGERGFFKRTHSGSESTSTSSSDVHSPDPPPAVSAEDRSQNMTSPTRNTVAIPPHEAVPQMNPLTQTFSMHPPPITAPSRPQSLSDIISSAALRNARVLATSNHPTPMRSVTKSPTTELEDGEVESMLEIGHEENIPSSTRISGTWRRPFKHHTASSNYSNQYPSRGSSVHSSPTPSSSSSGRLPRSTRMKRSTIIEKPGIIRFGLNIIRGQVDILMHKGRHPAKEFAALSVSAHLLPHTITYYLTQLSRTRTLSFGDIQEIFSDVIQVNTQEDEPDAPRIPIINDINPKEEPTPSHTYHYSNLMIHHECVPQPQCRASMLSHCKCTGGCKPHSCPCATRQMQYLPSNTNWSGFAYGANKTLRPGMLGYPIMECNMYCGCNDECQNRVVQNGRTSAVKVKIQKTAKKGWGVFADGDEFIPQNTFIGIYAGEYITIEEAEKREHIYNQSGRTYLFDIDFDFDSPEDEKSHKSVFKDEEEGAPSYCIDAFYTGNFTRYLNHSCDPNCIIMACLINESDIKKPLITIFSCKDILPGEELCLSYLGDMSNIKDGGSHSHETQVTICHCGSNNCIGRIWK